MNSRMNCASGTSSMVLATFYDITHRWLIQLPGELRTLFSQREAYADYLDRFFLNHNLPYVSWIHDLEKERFHSTAETLLAESEDAGELAAKEVTEQIVAMEARADLELQLMLSIGKLAHLAQMQEDTSVDESMLDGMSPATDPLKAMDTHDATSASFPRWSRLCQRPRVACGRAQVGPCVRAR